MSIITTDLNADLIDIQRSDAVRAGITISQAFRSDPLLLHIFDDLADYDHMAPWMFGTWVTWARLYGTAWATQTIDAVALCQISNRHRMGFWNCLRAGMYPTYRKLGRAAMQRLSNMGQIVNKARDDLMGTTPHWYCWVLAVHPESQGKGVGRTLMQETFKHADHARLPCYLETFSESNVAIHASQGFKLQRMIRTSDAPLTIFTMIREPISAAGNVNR